MRYRVFLGLLLLACWVPAADAQSPDDLAVYYVLPSDIPYEAKVHQRLVEATLDVQAWYQCATGGLTWNLAFPEVVRTYVADQPRAFYETGWVYNFWEPILIEMSQKGLALAPDTVTALWFRSAGWWAGANLGIALLGVEAFPELNDPQWSGGQCPAGQGGAAWPCTPEGAFAHELGHTVGLPHPFDDPALAAVAFHSLMQTHWNYPTFAPPSESPWGFLTPERQSLRASPFMHAGVELVQTHPTCDAVNLPPRAPAPQAAFEPSTDGLTLSTTNTSLGASLYYWTFGDGGVSNDVDAVHTYDRPGTYRVELRASGDNAVVDQATASVTVTSAGIDLVETAVSDPPAVLQPRGRLTVTDTVENRGGTSAGGSRTRYYLSIDGQKSPDDQQLGGGRAVPPLAPAELSTGKVTLQLPSTVAPGAYAVLACTDDTGVVTELNETNNCRASRTTVQVSKPDLVVAALSSSPAAAAPGSNLSVTDSTKNQDLVAVGVTRTRYYLSLQGVNGGTDRRLIGGRAVPGLAPGALSIATVIVRIPATTAPGTYRVLACADDTGAVPELSETNNCLASPSDITVRP